MWSFASLSILYYFLHLVSKMVSYRISNYVSKLVSKTKLCILFVDNYKYFGLKFDIDKQLEL